MALSNCPCPPAPPPLEVAPKRSRQTKNSPQLSLPKILPQRKFLKRGPSFADQRKKKTEIRNFKKAFFRFSLARGLIQFYRDGLFGHHQPVFFNLKKLESESSLAENATFWEKKNLVSKSKFLMKLRKIFEVFIVKVVFGWGDCVSRIESTSSGNWAIKIHGIMI